MYPPEATVNNELMKYTKGEPAPLRDRRVAKQAKKVYDEVRLSALQMNGATALAAHTMETLMELDAHRRRLAGDDPVTNQMLVEIELTAVRQVGRIQSNLFNQWGM
jgi:hypothetical protein